MAFCSSEYIFCFLPLFLVLYYIVPKGKNFILLVGSLVFYAVGDLRFTPLFLVSLIINYTIAILIEKNKVRARKRLSKNLVKNKRVLLIASIVFNAGMLFLFKYFTFFTGVETNWGLPLGISFYTFQIISYVADVYNNKTKAEINFIDLGVYLCMFPQVVQGPIIRYPDIKEQLKQRTFVYEEFLDGLKIFILGLGAKMIIADMMGMCWNSTQMYGIESISTKMAWMAMFAYTFQIYFDFWGYSLMAKGIGKMIGFDIPDNFNNPYMSKSVTDFWRRWHITLGSWFRDYIYIPLGGNRKGTARTVLNTFVVWALTGLWHGASWNFVLWGILFFVLLNIEKFGLKKILDKVPLLGNLYIIIVIPFSWVIFALTNLKDIGIYFAKLFPGISHISTEYVSTTDFAENIKNYWIFFLLAIIFSFEYPQKLYKKHKKTIVVAVILLLIFWISIYRVLTSDSNPFMYAQF